MAAEQGPADSTSGVAPERPRQNGWRTFGIIVTIVVLTLAAGYWLASVYLFPTEFTPVMLGDQQEQRLAQKLRSLGGGDSQTVTRQPPATEAYSEAGASREVSFTEKELNALLANNTGLASKLAIDLSEDLISANMLVDVSPDFPVLGGKTIKVTGGMELRLRDGRPGAVLKGISVWGVPLPNAWLGNMKNIDLLQEFGQAGGFWQAINNGVDVIEVKEGRLFIKLKE